MSRADLSCYSAAVFSVLVGIGLICCGVMENPQHWGRLTDAPLPRVEAVTQRPEAQARALSSPVVLPRRELASRSIGTEPQGQFHLIRYAPSDDRGAPALPVPVTDPLPVAGPAAAADDREGGAPPLAEPRPLLEAPAPPAAAATVPLPPRSPPRAVQTAVRAKALPRQRVAAQDPSSASTVLPSTGSGTPAKNAGINEFNSRNGGSDARPSGASPDRRAPSGDGSHGLLSWIFGGDDRPAPTKSKHRARASFASVEPTGQAAPDH